MEDHENCEKWSHSVARIGSKLEKTERQVSVFVLTGFFEDFLFSFSQLVSNLTLTE